MTWCFVIRERLTQELSVLPGITDMTKRIDASALVLRFCRKHWGTSANREIKDAMLERAFKLCESVLSI